MEGGFGYVTVMQLQVVALPYATKLKDITMLQAMDAQNIRILRKKMELQRLGLQRLLSTERCRIVL